MSKKLIRPKARRVESWSHDLKPGLALLRQSTPRQGDGVGDEIQKENIEQEAKGKGFEIVKWLYEIRSGQDYSSEVFHEVLDEISSGKYEALFVDELPRLGRSDKRFRKALRTATEHSVAIYSYYGKFDSTASLKERYSAVLIAYLGCESRRILETTRAAKALLKERGEKVDGPIPFGEMNNGYGRVENHEEQETIKMILALRKKRYSLDWIARALNTLGRPTKQSRNKSKNINKSKKLPKWHPTSVQNVIKRVGGTIYVK